VPVLQLDATGHALLPGLERIVPHLFDAHLVEVARCSYRPGGPRWTRRRASCHARLAAHRARPESGGRARPKSSTALAKIPAPTSAVAAGGNRGRREGHPGRDDLLSRSTSEAHVTIQPGTRSAPMGRRTHVSTTICARPANRSAASCTFQSTSQRTCEVFQRRRTINTRRMIPWLSDSRQPKELRLSRPDRPLANASGRVSGAVDRIPCSDAPVVSGGIPWHTPT